VGYFNLRKCGESDGYADLAIGLCQSIAKLLKREVKDRGNDCNPSGAVNIGLFNEAFILPIAKTYALHDQEEIGEVLKTAHAKILKEIARGQKMSADDWGGASSKRMHLNAFTRMAKNLETTLKILEKYPDQWMAQNMRNFKRRKKK